MVHTIAMCKVYAVVAIVVILRFVLPVPVHAVVVHVVRQLITAVVHLLHVIMIMVQVLVPVVVLMTIIVLLPALVLLAAIQQVAAHALAAAILQVVVAEAVLPVEAVEEDKQIRECNNSFELERTLIMNKKLTLVALSLLVSMGMGAQTIYDVTKMTEKDLNGTARFVGMGGAMGALGGDMSTIATNPAGIGIYRSNDVTASFGFSSTGTESTYGGNTFNSNKNRWQLNNAGFVLSNKIGNETTLRYVNFGFSYNRSKSFNKTTSMEGLLNLTGRLFRKLF